MKKKVKKIVATVLTVTMLFGVGSPALAETVIVDTTTAEATTDIMVETLYYNENEYGIEELFVINEEAYYYRNVSDERVLVISDNGTVREVVVNNLNDPAYIQYNMENIEGTQVSVVQTDVKRYSLEYFRELALSENISELEYTPQVVNQSVSQRASVSAELMNSIYDTFEEEGEPLENYSNDLIYGKVKNGVSINVYESCAITMSNDVNTMTFEVGKTLASIAALCISFPTNKVIDFLKIMKNVYGVYALAEEARFDRTGVFERVTRDGRVGSTSYYAPVQTTKWLAESIRSVDDNEYLTWYTHQYTNVTSNLFNDMSGLCDRVYEYYNS